MSTETAAAPTHAGRAHWPSVIASLAVGLAFFSLWFWLLPPLLGFRVELSGVTA